ncbi:Retrovirus-related Pol polyprotein from transposon [Apostichopus japonicus]|uniref:Retrovirus-related Pol polyprotein from transposon n=1 Tax=Stichopus japonicus TaxID=307972 RepID=A0A2G8L494_STIJA|nr:Retrovirus-related Pol polyprotein from transposon [Apostichopus japonicus]
MEPATSVESPTQSGKDNGQVVPEIVAPRLELDGAWVDQWSVEDIKKAQQGDNDISRIIGWMLISKERPQWSLISAENKTFKTYWGMWKVLCLRNGILYRKWESDSGNEISWKLVVARSMRNESTYAKVRGRSPMERVAMDILGPLPVTDTGNRYILCVADYFTKWTEAYAIPNQEAVTVARVFVEQFVLRFGVPLQLHTDQGRNFESNLFKELAQLLGIDKTRTTAFHPQSDGMVERFNRTLEAMLSAVVSENQRDWDEWLPHVTMAYRSSVHETTGETPSVMMLGREMNLPVDLLVPPPHVEISSSISYVSKLEEKLRTVHEMARIETNASVERQKKSYDRLSNAKNYNVGDKVWLYNPMIDERQPPTSPIEDSSTPSPTASTSTPSTASSDSTLDDKELTRLRNLMVTSRIPLIINAEVKNLGLGVIYRKEKHTVQYPDGTVLTTEKEGFELPPQTRELLTYR